MDDNAEKPISHEVGNQDFANNIENTQTRATYIDKNESPNISQEHHDYLMKRHGTVDLEPLPGFGDADPYNWPHWKVGRSMNCQQAVELNNVG